MRSRLVRTALSLLAVAALALVSAGSVAARGPDPETLQSRGWFCIDIAPIGLHCDNPGLARRTATEQQWLNVAAWPELVFDTTTGTFLGTEVGIRDDLWRPRPCPRDHDTWISDVGHMFCHHFDVP